MSRAKRPLALWMCDFETTTDPDDCRVWAWAACTVDERRNCVTGIDIQSFVQWVSMLGTARVWFHNAKFDMEFVFAWLLANGWEWVADKNELRSETFATLISDMGKFYCANLRFANGTQVEVRDSLKVIPMEVRRIPKAFGFSAEESKLNIDYRAYRAPGHELTPEEREYVLEDVRIVARALTHLLSEGKEGMTSGSNSLRAMKASIGGPKRFRKTFPRSGLRRVRAPRVPWRIHVGEPALSRARLG